MLLKGDLPTQKELADFDHQLRHHRRIKFKLKDLMKQQTRCAVHGHECHEGVFARSLYLGQRIPLAGVAHHPPPVWQAPRSAVAASTLAPAPDDH